MNYLYLEEEDNENKFEYNPSSEEINSIKIVESLINFSKKESNRKLNEIIIDLINFKKTYEKIDKLSEQNDQIKFKCSLYTNIQKNIMEIIYIKDKEKKEYLINKLYLWYKDKLKLYEELKYMKIKSYISPEEFDDEKYINEKYKDLFEERKKYISETDRAKKEMDHRSIESYNKITIESITNYRRKHILKIKKNKKLNSKISLEKRKFTPDIGRKNIFDFNYGKKNFDINLPFLNYSILKIDKTIIDNKNKLFSEKRSQEETEKKINEFSMNKSKYKSSLINKYEIKELISEYTKNNNFNSILLKKYKNIKKGNKLNNDTHNIKEDYSLIKRHSSIKNIDNQFEKFNNDNYNDYNDFEDLNFKQNFMRKPKKSLTEKSLNFAKRLFKNFGDKVIINDIHNLNYKTKKIIDQEKEKIIHKEIILKYPANKINKKLLNICLNYKKIPSDSVSKLTFHNDIFKQRLIYKRILNIPKDRERERDRDSESNLSNYFIERNYLVGDEYQYPNNNEHQLNCNLSAYNIGNFEKMKNNNSNFMELSEEKKTNKVKIYKIHNSYNLYKDNYLNLRKSISNFRKSEYQELLNLTKKEKNDYIDEASKTINIINSNKKESKEIRNNKKESKEMPEDKILFQKRINIFKEKKQNILSNAILNPNESNTFSKYYLPRAGSLLLSRYNINYKNK